MALDLDAYLSLHANALSIRARRAEVLANNLANADTPGFKARDIDFAAALKAATSAPASPPAAPNTNGTPPADPLAPFIKYRLPSQPSLDGNTVEVDSERAAFMDNAVRYQASLTFLNSRIKSLMQALTGE